MHGPQSPSAHRESTGFCRAAPGPNWAGRARCRGGLSIGAMWCPRTTLDGRVRDGPSRRGSAVNSYVHRRFDPAHLRPPSPMVSQTTQRSRCRNSETPCWQRPERGGESIGDSGLGDIVDIEKARELVRTGGSKCPQLPLRVRSAGGLPLGVSRPAICGQSATAGRSRAGAVVIGSGSVGPTTLN